GLSGRGGASERIGVLVVARAIGQCHGRRGNHESDDKRQKKSTTPHPGTFVADTRGWLPRSQRPWLDCPAMEGSSFWPRAGRVALVHDFLLDLRGAERVFLEMCEIWPQADIFTAVYDEAGTEGRFAHRTINTSFLQRLRPTARTFRALLPFYPAA